MKRKKPKKLKTPLYRKLYEEKRAQPDDMKRMEEKPGDDERYIGTRLRRRKRKRVRFTRGDSGGGVNGRQT